MESEQWQGHEKLIERNGEIVGMEIKGTSIGFKLKFPINVSPRDFLHPHTGFADWLSEERVDFPVFASFVVELPVFKSNSFSLLRQLINFHLVVNNHLFILHCEIIP